MLNDLADKIETLAMQRNTFGPNTCNQLKQVFYADREFMTPPDPPKRPIGFVAPEEKKAKR